MVSANSSDVGFGFVTALPIEVAAAQQLLDSQEPHTLRHDPGQYLLGEVPSNHQGRPHVVAVTVLPHDGKGSAAAASTSLLAGFPTIRAVIMIGIAGGVPAYEDPEKHMRLGDIVVAKEIIDYGYLRSVDGSQRLRGRLDSPSIDLLNADRILQAGEARGERPWEYWLGAGPVPVPQTFQRPGEQTDILMIGGRPVSHPDDTMHGRRPGYPRVHRGIVASGDQLVRDVALRERLAGLYGVCAIEMEGAGIAAASALRSVPWFMVRGIADYCDNATKNDLWHPYASLVAVAYVRALLSHCAPLETSTALAPRGVPPRSSRNGVTAASMRLLPREPDRRPSPLHHLQLIVEAILDIEQLLDNSSRRLLISTLPRNIQGAIAEQASPRLQVISIVRTCAGFHEGQEALVAALRMCVPDGSVALENAEAVIADYWHGITS